MLSHWVLDLIVHRPDLPIVPWGGPAVGFGLWRVRGVAIAVELVLVLAGSALYLRTVPRTPLGRAAFASVLGSGLVTLGLNAIGH